MELRSRQSRRYIIKARRSLQHDSSRVARCSGVSRALSWMKFEWAARREISCTPTVGWSHAANGRPMAVGRASKVRSHDLKYLRGTASGAFVMHVVPQESISMECCAMHEDGQGGFDRSRGRLLSATERPLPPPATLNPCPPPMQRFAGNAAIASAVL